MGKQVGIPAMYRIAELNYPQVNTFADLGDPALFAGKIYLVLTTTGVWFINRKRRGLWRSDGAVWTRMGVAPTKEDMGLGATDNPTFAGINIGGNLLNDYEEGAWTPDLQFGGAKVDITYANQQGWYTKIGRQVMLTGFMRLTNKGISIGEATILGLPFFVANNNSAYSPVTLYCGNITFADSLNCYCPKQLKKIILGEVTNAGVPTPLMDTDFSNNSEIMFSVIYFVD